MDKFKKMRGEAVAEGCGEGHVNSFAANDIDAFVGQSRSTNISGPFQVK